MEEDKCTSYMQKGVMSNSNDGNDQYRFYQSEFKFKFEFKFLRK